MTESILRDKAKAFAKKIVFLTKDVKTVWRENVMSNQLLRSGTSIGANIHEAQYAQGVADFVSKLEIALKECYESEYWLELMYETDFIEEGKYKELVSECKTIRKLIISSCTTAKTNNPTAFKHKSKKD